MFNFDALGSPDFVATGIIRVSVSDSFSAADASTYSIDQEIYTASSNEIAWTPVMIGNVQEILGIFSNFANVAFSWAGDFDTSSIGNDATPNPRDVGIAGVSDINIAWIYRSDVSFSGISGVNDDGGFGYTGGAGDIFLNQASFTDQSLGLDTRARQTLMHEIGHSLGFAHPFIGSALTEDFAATFNMGFSQLGFRILSAEDMNKEYFTIMSYDNQPAANAHTPMILDVIALQQAYGEGAGTTGAGNDTITAGTAGYRTYFDRGGVDTIDLSQYTNGATLHMGEQIVGADHLVGVAMSSVSASAVAAGMDPSSLRWFYGEFENAMGSPGSDTLMGNALSNSINGGQGNDTLNGAGGSDTLEGGAGDDSVDGGAGKDLATYASAAAAVVVSLATSGAQNTSGAGTDILVSIEDLEGSAFNDTLRGDANSNALLGLDGNDILIGGSGNDVLAGGSGIDTTVFSSPSSQYTITRGGSSVFVAGPDGMDSLSRVEVLHFSDRDIRFHVALAADFNGEGKSGFVVRFIDGTVEYRLMNGVNIASFKDEPLPTSWKIVSTDADFDGDGKSDVVLRYDAGTIEYRLMNGLNLAAFNDETLGASWRIASTNGDFNGDGKADVVLRHDSGTIEYRLMNGLSVAGFKDESLGTSWKIVSNNGDFNADGKSDVVLRHDAGTIEYRLMDGLSIVGFKDEALSTSWSLVSSSSDLNGDGKSDVVLRSAEGTIEYRLMNALTIAELKDEPIPSSWKIVSTDSDFNGDGKSDIVLRHDNGIIEYRLMDGLDLLGFKDEVLPLSWSVVSTNSDFNGDGKSDVVLRHDSGTVEYRTMDGLNVTSYRDEAVPLSWNVVDPHAYG